MTATYSLTLVRHGQSTWNLENRFTGWTDVGLTQQGEQEAHNSGKLLLEAGYRLVEDPAIAGILIVVITLILYVLFSPIGLAR